MGNVAKSFNILVINLSLHNYFDSSLWMVPTQLILDLYLTKFTYFSKIIFHVAQHYTYFEAVINSLARRSHNQFRRSFYYKNPCYCRICTFQGINFHLTFKLQESNEQRESFRGIITLPLDCETQFVTNNL